MLSTHCTMNKQLVDRHRYVLGSRRLGSRLYNKCYSQQKENTHDSISHVDPNYIRTNVIADYIEKMYTDINIVTQQEEGYECKYIAQFQMILLLALICFMFIDKRNPDDL